MFLTIRIFPFGALMCRWSSLTANLWVPHHHVPNNSSSVLQNIPIWGACAQVEFYDCDFVGNSAQQGGGAVALVEGSSGSFQGVTFRSNRAGGWVFVCLFALFVLVIT